MNLMLCAFLLLAPVTRALNFSQQYTYGPIPLKPDATLSYNIDFSAEKITFALNVSAPETLAGITQTTWLGIGISEPSSGSMLGSDIVTAQFDADSCQITDRHVPFAAFPLIQSVPGSQAVFPHPDECQDDGSWTLVNCQRDVRNGIMVLEVEKSFQANDDQDRAVGPGEQNVIHAYGTRFQYHDARRGSRRIALYNEDATVTPFDQQINLPDDITSTDVIVASNFTVPRDTTIYACTAVKLDVGGPGSRKALVGSEPILEADGDSRVHHMLLYTCRDSEYFRMFKETARCDGDDNPLANPENACTNLVAGYVFGSGRLIFPENVAFTITDDNSWMILETHYDNPNRLTNVVDRSGMRLFFSDEQRQYEASSLFLGDGFVSREGQVIESDTKYEHTCPSGCTAMFKDSINIFASILHMHTTGQTIYTNKFDKDQKFLQNVAGINFWSNNFQSIRAMDNPVKLNPGESLATTCTFDISKRPGTVFGTRTVDEMCLHVAFYYPAQKVPGRDLFFNACHFARLGVGDLTFCGNNGEVSRDDFFLIQNPQFNDTIGFNSTFGQMPASCPSSDTETVGDTPSSTPQEELDEAACFPADASVELEDGSMRHMSNLRIGDQVHVGRGIYSSVIMFTHQTRSKKSWFVKMKTESGHEVWTTRGHYIPTERGLIHARDVVKGDIVSLGNGGKVAVTGVELGQGNGLYNPQTAHGEIVVNGVVTSTYTEVIRSETAHALLTPVRFLYWITKGRREMSLVLLFNAWLFGK